MLKHWLAVLILFQCTNLFAQHDYKPSRNLIGSGKYEKAEAVLLKNTKEFPMDSEWIYQLAVTQTQLGKLDTAYSNLQKAFALDVFPGRAVADSHELLKPLLEKPEFESLVEEYRYTPIQGPMLGNVTSTSVSIWLRTAFESTVQAQLVATNGRFFSSPFVKTSKESNYVAKLEFERLQPNLEFMAFRITINGKQSKIELKGFSMNFKTPPKDFEPTHFKLAFGGGAGYVPNHERMWDTIANEKPDILCLLGDNIYSDCPKQPHMQKFCYYRRQSPNQYRKLVAKTPVYTIWDDHDFGTNDCWGGPKIDSPKWKQPVWKIYRNNWINPGYGGGEKQAGCWYDFYRGDVHFIMLDGRYYRDPKGKTMLGPIQKAWLKEKIASSKGTFKIITSPVPWEYRTKGDSKDTWNGFKEERTEIFDFLTKNKSEGVILMSADRHRSDAWKIDRPEDYSLYEFNSSRLTNNHVHKTKEEAIFSYNKKQSFGLVEFNTKLKDPTVTYTVVSIDGEKIDSLTLKKSQLK